MRRTTVAAVALAVTTGIAGAGAASAASPTSTVSYAPGTEIRFAHGATSGHVTGRVTAGGDRLYFFGAEAGQTVTFHLARSTSAMTWTLVGPSGPSVHNAHSSRQSDFSYRLPETGFYYVDITSTRAASYDLSVSIPRG